MQGEETIFWQNIRSKGSRLDGSELETLWKQQRHRVYGLARGLLRDGHLAEDAVLEAFRRLVVELRRSTPHCPAEAFLFKVTRNICIDWLRRSSAEKARDHEVTLMSSLLQQTEPIDQAIQDEGIARLRAARAKLPPEVNEVLALRYDAQLSDDESSDVLMISKGAFQSRVHRATEQLREIMGEPRSQELP